jgi:hypothetical protein
MKGMKGIQQNRLVFIVSYPLYPLHPCKNDFKKFFPPFAKSKPDIADLIYP